MPPPSTAETILSESEANERLREYVLSARRNLIKYEDQQAAKLLKAFRGAEETVHGRLVAMAAKVDDWTHGDLVVADRLVKLQRQIGNEIAGVIGRAGDLTGASMRRVYAGELYNAADGLAAVGIDTTGAALSRKQIEAVASLPIQGAPYGERYHNLTRYARQRVREELTQSLIMGEGMDGAARRLTRVLEYSQRVANTIARTGIMTAANTAASDLYRQYPDVLEGRIWDATFDDRTCAECGDHDGELYALDGPEALPAHHQCRCVWVPKVKGMALGPRRARTADGKTTIVPSGTTWRDWIVRQPRGVVEGVFGKTRAELLLSGKLELKDLYTDGALIKARALKSEVN